MGSVATNGTSIDGGGVTALCRFSIVRLVDGAGGGCVVEGCRVEVAQLEGAGVKISAQRQKRVVNRVLHNDVFRFLRHLYK